jgi:hypothetical protein
MCKAIENVLWVNKGIYYCWVRDEIGTVFCTTLHLPTFAKDGSRGDVKGPTFLSQDEAKENCEDSQLAVRRGQY